MNGTHDSARARASLCWLALKKKILDKLNKLLLENSFLGCLSLTLLTTNTSHKPT
jgi:hypothetical protein